MKYRHLVVLIIVVLAAMGSARKALADAAPPPPPPAGSVENGEYPTMVQMESENVIMTIADDIAYVKATFNMRNQGTEEEAFDVRFPVDTETYSPNGMELWPVYNFAAYVDGRSAEVTYVQYPDLPLHWATWHVTFPPGQGITLGVIYQVDPYIRSAENYQEYNYILHTGAGWFGSIGEGTITVRLPYEVNEFNMFIHESSTLPGHTTSGTDATWNFTDFEPTEQDDITVDVMSPQSWRAIQSAQREVEENPDSVDAHLKLAHALLNGMANRAPLACFASVGNAGEQMLARAEGEYQQALEIAPNNIDIYIDYIGFLGMLDICGRDRQAQIREAAQRLWTIDPGNEELLAILKGYEITEYLTPIPTRSPTRIPPPMPTRAPTIMPTSETTIITVVIPTPMPTPLPTSSPNTTPPIGLWVAIGAAVIGGAAVGVWVYRKRANQR